MDDENISSSNDDVVDYNDSDDVGENIIDDDSHSSLRRNNNNDNNFALIETTTNEEFVDDDEEHNNNDTKNGKENFSDVDDAVVGFVPLSPFVEVMKMDYENSSIVDERNNILNDSQGTTRRSDADAHDASTTLAVTENRRDIEVSLNNNNTKCCANSSDEDESSTDSDDSDSACSDDDVSSPPCVRCKRKRKLTDGSDTNGDFLSSNKRSCSLSTSTQQLQGLITVFKNGLSSMNVVAEPSSSVGNNNSSVEIIGTDGSTSSVVGSRQQNNLNRTLSCPAIWELTCAS